MFSAFPRRSTLLLPRSTPFLRHPTLAKTTPRRGYYAVVRAGPPPHKAEFLTSSLKQPQRAEQNPTIQAHVIPHPEKAGQCSLLSHIKEYVEENEDSSPYEALLYGYTENIKKKAEGSTTVVLAKVVGRELHALYLGDSSLAIFRNNEMIYKTEEQVHSFNYPYQLGTGGDSPSQAQCIQCTMKRGDLVVLATDGLFDNLFPDEITDVLRSSDPNKIAINLAVSAMAAACSSQKETPFGERVAEETDQIWSGGKMDDVTVVAYRVQ